MTQKYLVMKKRFIFSILLALLAIVTCSAQDLQEILDNHFETIGQEKILLKESVFATGKIMQMGMELPFEMINKRPNKVKIIIDIQGSKIIQAYDGETVWAVNPLSGSSEPIDVTGPEADGLIESADMDGQLWNYEEKGHQLELEGTEEIEGVEVYVLKLSKKNGNIDYIYMDPDSYLITNTKSKVIMQGQEVESEMIMSNYQDIDGYIMPFTMEQRANGQVLMTIMIEEVKVDQDFDDSIFSK